MSCIFRLIIIFFFVPTYPVWAYWRSIATEHTHIADIYVDQSSVYIASWGKGVYQSISAERFLPLEQSTENRYPYCIALDPPYLLAGFGPGSVRRINLGVTGATWELLPGVSTQVHVFSVVAHADEIIFGTWRYGAYRQSSRGQIAQKMHGISHQTPLYAFFQKKDRVWAGSKNQGVRFYEPPDSNWQYGGLDRNTVVCFTASATKLFAGTWQNGVFMASLGDTVWQNIGLEIRPVRALLYDENSSELYAGLNEKGLFKTDNMGKSWGHVGCDTCDVTALAMNNTHLYIGTWGSGLYRYLLQGPQSTRRSTEPIAKQSSEQKRSGGPSRKARFEPYQLLQVSAVGELVADSSITTSYPQLLNGLNLGVIFQAQCRQCKLTRPRVVNLDP